MSASAIEWNLFNASFEFLLSLSIGAVIICVSTINKFPQSVLDAQSDDVESGFLVSDLTVRYEYVASLVLYIVSIEAIYIIICLSAPSLMQQIMEAVGGASTSAVSAETTPLWFAIFVPLVLYADASPFSPVERRWRKVLQRRSAVPESVRRIALDLHSAAKKTDYRDLDSKLISSFKDRYNIDLQNVKAVSDLGEGIDQWIQLLSASNKIDEIFRTGKVYTVVGRDFISRNGDTYKLTVADVRDLRGRVYDNVFKNSRVYATGKKSEWRGPNDFREPLNSAISEFNSEITRLTQKTYDLIACLLINRLPGTDIGKVADEIGFKIESTPQNKFNDGNITIITVSAFVAFVSSWPLFHLITISGEYLFRCFPAAFGFNEPAMESGSCPLFQESKSFLWSFPLIERAMEIIGYRTQFEENAFTNLLTSNGWPAGDSRTIYQGFDVALRFASLVLVPSIFAAHYMRSRVERERWDTPRGRGVTSSILVSYIEVWLIGFFVGTVSYASIFATEMGGVVGYGDRIFIYGFVSSFVAVAICIVIDAIPQWKRRKLYSVYIAISVGAIVGLIAAFGSVASVQSRNTVAKEARYFLLGEYYREYIAYVRKHKLDIPKWPNLGPKVFREICINREVPEITDERFFVRGSRDTANVGGNSSAETERTTTYQVIDPRECPRSIAAKRAVMGYLDSDPSYDPTRAEDRSKMENEFPEQYERLDKYADALVYAVPTALYMMLFATLLSYQYRPKLVSTEVKSQPEVKGGMVSRMRNEYNGKNASNIKRKRPLKIKKIRRG